MWQSSCARTCCPQLRESAWRVWTDANRWPGWVRALEAVRLDSDFVPGARFTRKPKAARRRARAWSVEPSVLLTGVTVLPLARLDDAHEIEAAREGLRLVGSLIIEGPLAGLGRRRLVQGIGAAPRPRDALARRAAAA